ncbi:MAG: hypothetical protein JXN62_11295 [Bacteroidales bacterium]|nr:hypothetical protein [Bacteroidales bacterium]
MKAHNPVIILRNHRFEQEKREAEKFSELSPLHALLDALNTTYIKKPNLHEFQKLPLESERVKQTLCRT